MHSAPACQQNRLCTTLKVSRQVARPVRCTKYSRSQKSISIPLRARSYAEHVKQDLHSSSTSPVTAEDKPSVTNSDKAARLDDSMPHVAVFKASKQYRHPIQEKQRPLVDYMRLPASQYSVLDAKKIERLDDDTFMCYVGGLNFLGFAVEPVLTVSVIVQDRGPVVRLLDTKLEGSKAIVAANDRFAATMTNTVTWEGDEGQEDKHLCSDTSIQVRLEVPVWARLMPTSAIASTGSRVMQTVLNSAVPKFLKQLQKDYELWATGDESRKPIGTGQL